MGKLGSTKKSDYENKTSSTPDFTAWCHHAAHHVAVPIVLYDKSQQNYHHHRLLRASLDSTIPSSIDGTNVTSIAASAFASNFNLTSVTLGNGITSIGNSAFFNCESLTNVTIPNSVTSIGTYAFNYCYSLVNVTIPNSVTSIGGGAFQYCTSLTSITIPKSVTVILGGSSLAAQALQTSRSTITLLVSGILSFMLAVA